MAQSVLQRKTGVIVGDDVLNLFKYAQEKQFAIPAINVTSSSTVIAALEAAREKKSPIILQISQGGAAFWAGKGVANKNQEASIAGAVAGALYIRAIAPTYEVPVILHSDHCSRALLAWLDGMISEDMKFFEKHGEPLFSSHMIDLSEEDVDWNIKTTAEYFKRVAPMKQWLEMTLEPISPYFSIAAGFGNVHGVYKPGNVRLHPELLLKHQKYVKEEIGGKNEKPVFFVFHGGSGSSKKEFKDSISYGVVKVNIDTDTQFAYAIGIRDFMQNKREYLQSQVGNPEGEDKPNKKYFDPRVFIREGEKTMSKRVAEALDDFNASGQI